ncbi:MAG TPA: hypothetical protein VLC46_10905 [Thermoanaerobaculia bacterium]|jgi:hypothetical protein|nr:hypothetical protein [Thermoanaerobaculia bacterium]
MSTGQKHDNDKNELSFESINGQINDYVNVFIDPFESLDEDGEGAVAAPQTAAERAQRLMTMYAGVRPILLALASVPLVPAAWRSAISVFVITLDGVTDTFKAGKDLAVGDGGSASTWTSTVEMEPKLPVG